MSYDDWKTREPPDEEPRWCPGCDEDESRCRCEPEPEPDHVRSTERGELLAWLLIVVVLIAHAVLT